ncbi:MAG: hypothetical protein AAF497_24165 [Planctomycetota bacterium]
MPERSRRQFTISAILILMVVAALAVVGWQKYIYVHPAHKNSLYEKAGYTNNGKIRINGNTLALERIARSDRDGTLAVEEFTHKTSGKAGYSDILQASGPWLDTAQVELNCVGNAEGERPPMEIIEVRVFDFATRELISKTDVQSGYRMIDPITLQLYRLGGYLPDRVDLWFRVRSYPDLDVEIVKLTPRIDATAKGFGGEFRVTNLVRGFKSYRRESLQVTSTMQRRILRCWSTSKGTGLTESAFR